MTRPFSIGLVRDLASMPAGISVANAVDICAAPSSNGHFTVVVLGNSNAAKAASRIAENCAEGCFDPSLQTIPGSGIVIIDHSNGTAQIVMPRLGIGTVFWRAAGENLWVASDPGRLAAAGGNPGSIMPTALFRYLYFHMLPASDSIYAMAKKLPGGHSLAWTDLGTKIERYWHPQFEARPFSSETEAADELRKTLRSAVTQSLDPTRSTGAFLSGGLDSSTVAGMAAEVRPGLQTVTMGFDAPGYDEMQYARIAARRFGTRPIEYYVTPDDVHRTLPKIAAAFPEPFGNSSAAAVYHCARIAREHGLELLLAGDGGDELFGGNDRYAKQLIFERYGRLPEPVRRWLIEPAASSAARVTTRYPIGKAQSYIQQAKVPLPDRLQHYNFLHQHLPEHVFTPDLLAQIDVSAPAQELRDEYRVPDAGSPIDRMLFLDWKFTLHDNDLVKVNTMCSLGGVDVAYPMLDPDVVNFSLRLPADWKVRDGELRWFYKRAMQNFLPNEILHKTKHGFGLPFGVWTRTHEGLRRLSEDALSSLGTRGFFRSEFLNDALRLHREGHASFYGELVWILMVLELWLQAHAPDVRC